MYTQSGCYRPRGYSTLFRAGYSDQHIRVSDAERQEVADRLAEHFASGRLDQAEFDDRVGRAMGAKTRADLGGLFSDLPDTGAPVAPEHLRYRRRYRHPILLLAAVIALIVVAAHAPWLWVGFGVVAVLFLTGNFGRPRQRQDRS